jgi:hypothetical protein
MEHSQRQLFAFYEREVDRLLTLARECRDLAALRRLLRMTSDYVEKLGWSARGAKFAPSARPTTRGVGRRGMANLARLYGTDPLESPQQPIGNRAEASSPGPTVPTAPRGVGASESCCTAPLCINGGRQTAAMVNRTDPRRPSVSAFPLIATEQQICRNGTFVPLATMSQKCSDKGGNVCSRLRSISTSKVRPSGA